jgi:hypothetical protein
MPGRGRTGLVFVAVSLVGGLAAWAIFAHADQRKSTEAVGNMVAFETNPIGPGAQVTVDVPAEANDLPFQVLLPQSDDPAYQPKSVWTRVDSEPAIAVQLQSGVFILERAAEKIDFPTDEYYRQLGDGVPGASVTEVNKASALLIQSSDSLGNPSSVDVIVQGVHLSVIGSPGQDTSELVALVGLIPASGAGRPIAAGLH